VQEFTVRCLTADSGQPREILRQQWNFSPAGSTSERFLAHSGIADFYTVIVREMRPNEVNAPLGVGHSVTIRVEDVDAQCNRAKEHGARITQEPVTHPYGERQYNADDLAGHSWTFSESVADMHPEDWGGMAEQL